MFEGVLIAAITPFRNQHVDEPAIARNFELWNATGVSGYLVLGSTGEFVHLMFTEKVEVLRLAKKYAAPRKKMIAGIGCDSVFETVRLAGEAAELGYDAVMAVTPHYYKPALKTDVLRRYFLEIADQIELPLFLYNIPQNTGVNLEASLVAELARHPRIRGIKDSSGKLAQLYDLLQIGGVFAVFCGNIFAMLSALMMGAPGNILAFANAAPAELSRVYELAREGKHGEAMKVLQVVLRLGRHTLDRYGIPGLKKLMELRGYDPGEPRLPLAPVSAQAAEEIQRAYDAFQKEIGGVL